jgi:hypothetical protein
MLPPSGLLPSTSTAQTPATIPNYHGYQNLDNNGSWDSLTAEMELLMQQFKEERQLRLQGQDEMEELKGALVKSSEKLQRIQATLEKPLNTSSQNGNGKIQRLLHMTRGFGRGDESANRLAVIRGNRGGLRPGIP